MVISMIHILYIYLIINIFILGAYINSSDYRFDNTYTRYIYCFLLIFFGGIIVILDLISPKILNCFEYIIRELKFQYRMLFTDYFDKIYLDDEYTELYDSREKKLKKTEELAQKNKKKKKKKQKKKKKKKKK